ncbi:MAG: flagellar hook protein FlgE [Pseudomonadota bacterium]
MGFQQGLSGLNGAAKNLDVIGNNIANASTVGFKASQTQFADVYATSLYGAGGLTVGIGTKVSDVAQQFTQGNVAVTNNPLDIAISGEGFFRMEQDGVITYSRNGQFNLDKDGFIINASNQQLTGYLADSNGSIIGGGIPVPIQISLAPSPPQVTSEAELDLNLDSQETAIAAATLINPSDPDTYNHSTSFTVYDEAGNPHGMVLYFQKNASNTWVADAYVNGTQVTIGAGGASGAGMTLGFNTDGSINTINGAAASAQTLTIPAGTLGTGAAALVFDANFNGFTQYGSAFGVSFVSQDGYGSGRIAGVAVDREGVILGRYTNGQTRNLGQVILHSFLNPQGLQPIGNNQWFETAESGQATYGAPGSGVLGYVQSGSIEESNVDMTAELVNLIVAQRMYQANAQTIRAQDQILQTLVNLR